jgi:hypothetical protein
MNEFNGKSQYINRLVENDREELTHEFSKSVSELEDTDTTQKRKERIAMGANFSKKRVKSLYRGYSNELTSGLEVITDLKLWRHLMRAVDGKTLSGAAYNAGKGLFGELIVPTIDRCGQTIEEMGQDLQTYISANNAVQAASTDTLDEDKLEQKIRESELYRNTTKMTADALSSQAFEILTMTNPVTAMVSMANQLFDIQSKLNSYVESLDQDIEK